MKPSNTPNSPGAVRPPLRSWAGWWRSAAWPMLVVAILVLFASGLIYLQNTLVTGTELNSHTWEIRKFSFRRDPFTQTQFTGIDYGPAHRSKSSWIVQNDSNTVPDPVIQGHLTAASSIPVRWDLISLRDRINSEGRASILVQLLDAFSASSSAYWLDWTKREPNKAAVMWPAAQHLVLLGLYSQLPDLFEIALYEKDDARFTKAVTTIMQAALLQHARELAASEDQDAVREVVKIGLSYGSHAELQAMAESP